MQHNHQKFLVTNSCLIRTSWISWPCRRCGDPYGKSLEITRKIIEIIASSEKGYSLYVCSPGKPHTENIWTEKKGQKELGSCLDKASVRPPQHGPTRFLHRLRSQSVTARLFLLVASFFFVTTKPRSLLLTLCQQGKKADWSDHILTSWSLLITHNDTIMDIIRTVFLLVITWSIFCVNMCFLLEFFY